MKYTLRASPLDYCLEKSFEVYSCSNCGFGETTGVTGDDLKLVYEGGAYDVKEKFWHRMLRPVLNLQEGGKLAYLGSGKREGRLLLEVGTGKGNFLAAAISAGFDGFGIEPSTRSFSIAKKLLNDKVYQCGLEDLHTHETLNRKYDYIFLWHVLEHLNDPEDSIYRLKALLKPNGLLIFGVPNRDSFQAKYGGRNWYHLDPPRHLSHFTPKAIGHLLDKTGMRIEKIYFNSLFQNFLGEIITLNNSLIPHKNIFLNILRANSYYKTRTSAAARAINLVASLIILTIAVIPTFLWTLIVQLLRKSGTMVVVGSNKA